MCTAADFALAVRLVGRHQEQVRALITREVPLAGAAAAVAHAMRNPAEMLKLVIRMEGA